MLDLQLVLGQYRPMNITKRMAKALEKRNFAEIGRQYEPPVSKQGVSDWIKNLRVPDERVPILEKFTGLKIK